MKLTIPLPEIFAFRTRLQVRASDVNYGGHLGNDSVLTLLQEARIHFYHSMGFRDETSLDGSIGQIITEFLVQYKGESFMGDPLTIELHIAEIHKYGFNMVYRITHEETGKEIARAQSTNLCFDYSKRKVASIPQQLMERINETINKDI